MRCVANLYLTHSESCSTPSQSSTGRQKPPGDVDQTMPHQHYQAILSLVFGSVPVFRPRRRIGDLDDLDPDTEQWKTSKDFLIRDICLRWFAMVLKPDKRNSVVRSTSNLENVELLTTFVKPDTHAQSKKCASLMSQLRREIYERVPKSERTNSKQLLDFVTETEDPQRINQLFQQSSLQMLIPMERGALERTENRNLRPSDPRDTKMFLMAYSTTISDLFGFAHHEADSHHLFHLLRNVSQSEAEISTLLEADSTVLQKLVDLLVRLTFAQSFLNTSSPNGCMNTFRTLGLARRGSRSPHFMTHFSPSDTRYFFLSREKEESLLRHSL